MIMFHMIQAGISFPMISGHCASDATYISMEKVGEGKGAHS